MKKIEANIIADSKNEFGDRITTFVCTFPRIILSELNTHRMFSRNSASSRAIPFNKMVKMVEEDPFIPIAWQKDHKGMQGTEYFEDEIEISDKYVRWLGSKDKALESAKNLAESGVTKQLCNRLLESFMWHTAIITATEFENFFKLRCPDYIFHDDEKDEEYHFRSRKDVIKFFGEDEFVEEIEKPIKDLSDLDWLNVNQGQGEIHIMALAEAMWDAVNESTPKELKAGEWHIPFGNNLSSERIYELFDIKQGKTSDEFICDSEVKIATARCARVSYLNFEGKDSYEVDIKLHDRLFESGHYSPFEHCARAMSAKETIQYSTSLPRLGDEDNESSILTKQVFGTCRNFKGFVQYRSLIENK